MNSKNLPVSVTPYLDFQTLTVKPASQLWGKYFNE